MNVLNLIRPTEPATPADNARRDHIAKRAALNAQYLALAEKHAAAASDLAQLTGIKDGLAAARVRRLDLIAARELGADNSAALAAVEADIRAAEQRESECSERAEIAGRKRALLKPQLDQLRNELHALDAALPALKTAARKERLFAYAMQPETAQTLRAARAVIAELAALNHDPAVAGGLDIPLPNYPEIIRALDFDRRELAKAITERMAALDGELSR
jgi:hypothetical protein